jgi:RNA-directed DNA polymerase
LRAIPDKRFKDRVRQLTPRNHPMNVEAQMKRLNRLLQGWINYFRIANYKSLLEDVMQWIRRRLCMEKMREWKSWKALHCALRRDGYQGDFPKISMRRWRKSASPLVDQAFPNKWFDQMGLVDLTRYKVGTLHPYRPR